MSGAANTLQPRATAREVPTPRVELQVNRTGLWHAVVQFDASCELAEAQMRTGVEALAAIDRATAFRVVTLDSQRRVLCTFSNRFGWTGK